MTSTQNLEVTSPQLEVIKSMEGFVGEQLPKLLLDVDECWQPSDFLPDLTSEDRIEHLAAFQSRVKCLPDDLLVVLVGDMVTEEALPTYQTWLNRLNGVTDPTGASPTPWARWSRGWTAEENRHGDLLNKYLYLTGRVDMRSIEVTIHHLINNGFDPKTENDPYLGFVYTSFQERATKISHRNVGTLAKKAGEDNLHKICGIIAGDEARHEKAYKLFMAKIFELDPARAVLAFAKMMKTKIVMPAVLMDDGNGKNMFTKFSLVAQKTGIYTVKDYAEIIGTLVSEWKIGELAGISGVPGMAQEYLCKLSERYHKLAERIKYSGTERFSWIYDREIALS